MWLLVVSSCSRSTEVGLHPGDLAPEFTLQDLSGSEHSLSAYRGKVVLLNFWASWCGPCIAEMPALQRLYNRLQNQGFVVLAIGVDDDLASLKRFKDMYSLTFPILVDSSRGAASRYKINGFPESYVINRKGMLTLVPDPQNFQPVIKIVGPRAWDSETALKMLAGVLK